MQRHYTKEFLKKIKKIILLTKQINFYGDINL